MRKVLSVVAAVLVASTTTIGLSGTAGAADVCKSYPISGRSYAICTLLGSGGNSVSGLGQAGSTSNAEVVENTVYVTQCRGNLTHCGTIAANSTGNAITQTSYKPTAFGHVYRACGSLVLTNGARLINVCGPWRVG